ncbi:hypothetical protein M2163_000267 [Streptomyces sp. SAI-135]|uniref:hypothetical protein n=1 Tax=unclassified Streptomyces TaxID=2593676 RepID=UPI002476375D|nr:MULTISPECIES: hypothetical protein [unclassified Streptomyces]MDH6523228.1 hypothetical protein [Streptomyces sp. SAI-090]MDH6554842.1 hypothetical protein [Streptomyces sp. SAI-041]MDH6574112.1 hypothetical protein [Streptomyces sp. SAI-117]MDH6581152.1 hypothetical protein [Streptomyces sp. SAI-133]MDH6613159.1 hypothetical protein [Streptomyces sp. SAI-135]
MIMHDDAAGIAPASQVAEHAGGIVEKVLVTRASRTMPSSTAQSRALTSRLASATEEHRLRCATEAVEGRAALRDLDPVPVSDP